MSKELKQKQEKCLYECDENEIDKVVYKELAKYFPRFYLAYVIYGTIFNLIISAIIAISTRDLSTTLITLLIIQISVLIYSKVNLPHLLEKEINSNIKKGIIESNTHKVFYDDYFTKENNNKIIKVYYNEISKAIETETSFYLYVSKLNIVIFIQKSFCSLELINFIRDKINDLENHLGESSGFKGAKKYHNPKFIKNFMIILFIMTLFSIYGAECSLELINKINPQYGFNFVKNYWVFWLWLPLPILSIVLGYKYKRAGFKCTKNIVGGFIIFFILFMVGLNGIISTNYNEDYSNINDYINIINASVPSSGELQIINFDNYFNDDISNYSIINVYYAKQDINDLYNSIVSSDTWILSTELKSELKILYPQLSKIRDDTYYSIYNKTTNEYNTLPNESGKYEIYSMYFSKELKQLTIEKYIYNYIK